MGDQGRPLEKGPDRSDVRAFESNLGEAVLGDLHGRASLLHLLAQTLHLGDGQAGIMRHDHHRRLREDVVESRNRFFLFRSVHGAHFSGRRVSPPVAHAAPREPHGLERRDDLRLSPELGRTQRRTEGSNRIQPAGKPAGLENPVVPVYAGPLGPFGPSGIKRLDPKVLRAPAVSDRTWPSGPRGLPLRPPAYPPPPSPPASRRSSRKGR